ncbi:hypothetical protein KEM55_008187 [Ascosphaera atra]|nr:hypothetical protein KEM55_008187 [Ascosphaera atra]
MAHQERGFINSASAPPGAQVLPAEKMFPIQIGSQLFRLSGASIMSDAPSYFSHYFAQELGKNEDGSVATLCIDRDPETFSDIAKHLQGYHIPTRDELHFVRLFADAQFYSLPRLISQLFESDLVMQVGGKTFHIPRDLISAPANSPNYFSLGFALFFSDPQELFPGLDRTNLLRPPSVHPPSLPNRDPEIFSDLLRMLRGYDVHVRNEEHRAALLRDCRYFRFRAVEQRLIPHQISYNVARRREEIVVRLEDVRQSGLQVVGGEDASATARVIEGRRNPYRWVHYSRPSVDEKSYELIVQIGGGGVHLDTETMRLVVQHGQTQQRMSKLLEILRKKCGAASSSETQAHGKETTSTFQVQFTEETAVTLDGRSLEGTGVAAGAASQTQTSARQDPFIAAAPGEEGLQPVVLKRSRAPGPELDEYGHDTAGHEPPSKRVATQSRGSTGMGWHSVGAAGSVPLPAPAPDPIPMQQQQQQLSSSVPMPAAGTPVSFTDGEPKKEAKSGKPWMLNTSQWRVRVISREEATQTEIQQHQKQQQVQVQVKQRMGTQVNTTNNNDEGHGAEPTATATATATAPGPGPATSSTTTAVDGAGIDIVLVAVKLEAYTGERARNQQRQFI